MDRFSSLVMETDGESQRLELKKEVVQLTGDRLKWYRWVGCDLGVDLPYFSQ
jgi:hypothetical protein